MPLDRIAVVGTTGSGKTTFARRVAAARAVPHVQLDALHWGPGWQAAEPETFRARVAAALAGGRWVVDGNYAKVQDIVWVGADTVVFLDYPLPVMFGRLLRRTVRRVSTREHVWGHSRETVRNAFFSRDSLFVWQWNTFRRNRRRYRGAATDPRWAHLGFVSLRSPAEADRWLASLPTLRE